MACRVEELRRTWEGIEFRSASQEIGEPTEWNVESDRHTLKVLRSGEVGEYSGEIESGPSRSSGFRAGDVSLVPAGRAYRSRGCGTLIAYSVVSFADAGEARPLLGGRDDFVHHTVKRMHEAFTAGEETLGETLGWALVLHLRSRYLMAPPAEEILSARQKRHLDEYLRAHLGARPSVADLARELGMGRSRFAAAFRNSYETTPAQHVLGLRLTKARLRLEATPCDIAELALELGFSSHGHLTTTFKRRFGIPPRDVRARASVSRP